MSLQELMPSKKATVFAFGKWLTLPDWLVAEASQRVIEKAVTLTEQYRGITKFQVFGHDIVAKTKGSSGKKYSTRIAIWDYDNPEARPAKTSCSCLHGRHSSKGLCYHRVAVILKVLSMGIKPLPRYPQKYEDDFNLE
jgi:uncharacterized Zn finger protein